MGREDALLLAGGQSRVERHDVEVRSPLLGEEGRCLAYLSFAGLEDENVARPCRHRFLEHRPQMLHGRVVVVADGLVGGSITDLDGIRAPGHLYHRGAVEMARESLWVDGRRGDDELELRPPRQQLL